MVASPPRAESTQAVQTYGNYIAGEWRPAASGETMENRNPANRDEVVGLFASSGADDVDAAIAAAEEAYRSWRFSSPMTRANILHKAANILESRIPEVGRELTREEGKTLKEGIGETTRAVQILRYFAGEAQQPSGEHYPSVNPHTALHHPRATWGRSRGHAVELSDRDSGLEDRSRFGVRQYRRLQAGQPDAADRGPPGGSARRGWSARGCAEPGHRVGRERRRPIGARPAGGRHQFTGSNETGAELRRSAAERGAKLQLELGGKNPAIVLADADLEHALGQVVAGAMMSTGQKCTATSRAIVDRRIIDRFTEMLADRIGGLKVGDPLDAETQIGPLIDERAADRVAGEVDAAKQAGAELVVGGERLGSGLERGAFLAPTLFADVDPKSRLGQDELFGPVLGVIPVDSMEEAMAVANQVKFGLSASIFTRDLGRALAFAREIEAGVVHVNSETAGAEPQVPFGGMKGSSSYSREQGKAAREFFTQVKTVYIDPPPLRHNGWW